MTSTEVLADQREWLRVRASRAGQERAALLYPPGLRADCGPVLAGPGWLAAEPVELDRVRLVRDSTPRPVPVLPGPVDHVLPLREANTRYRAYSEAVGDLVRPALFENRATYRLLNVRAAGSLELTFGAADYFDCFDAREALAHEYRLAALGGAAPGWDDLPLRRSVADPFDFSARPVSIGISTLTIRRDKGGEHRFLLHQRNSAAVADGGGLHALVPAGEFQPTSAAESDVRADFSLWRNTMRELSEELLGNPERAGAVDYATEEPFRSFARAWRDGVFRLWHLGLVVDPVTLGPSLRTVAVVDGDAFDRLFAGLVETNQEGRLVTVGSGVGVPFTAAAIDRLAPRLSVAARASLRLARRFRRQLLDG